jgi:hypothetical protein
LSPNDLATKYSFPLPTVYTILKNKDKLWSLYQENKLNSKNTKIRPSPDLDRAMLEWFTDRRSNNCVIDGWNLKLQAERYATMLQIDDFKASNGWLDRFKKRHHINSHQLSGEANDADIVAAEHWKKGLHLSIENYLEAYIYNPDETGLFFRLKPDKTLAFSG